MTLFSDYTISLYTESINIFMRTRLSSNMEFHLLSPNSHHFPTAISSAKGVFVGNENSMIDIDKIEEFNKQEVGPESVNLDNMTGNRRVLSLIELMKDNRRTIFFPGTLLRDYGGYCLPVMPVIHDGKIIREQVKQDGVFYDNEIELARHLLGEDFAERVRHASGDYFDEPLKTLQATLRREVMKKRVACLSPINVGGRNFLPIICSDLSSMANALSGEKIDFVVHACSNYFRTNEERKEAYIKYLGKMAKRGNLAREVVIAVSEQGGFLGEFPSFKGVFVYSHGKLSTIRQETF